MTFKPANARGVPKFRAQALACPPKQQPKG
jgi:hypothetical protein